ncbi:MAG: lipoyl(octanoyl) transferase LipB [Nannocystaceae bacterium]|nr:lipoyl(octanoyl) transferase LipB [Nannocystaceae bacterium]
MTATTPTSPAAPVALPARGAWLGREGFADTLQRQLAARDALADGTGAPVVFAVEHPPVLTLGRRGTRDDVLWTDAQLAEAGVEVCASPRGGQVTLHAPGQLVVYPVVRIGWRIRAHIVGLGEAAAALLIGLGIPEAEFRLEQPGVWVGPRKIASIGVHVSRGITVQGIAINLDPDETLFGALVSCGLSGVQMTSVRRETGAAPSVQDTAGAFVRLWAARYGAEVTWPSDSP